MTNALTKKQSTDKTLKQTDKAYEFNLFLSLVGVSNFSYLKAVFYIDIHWNAINPALPPKHYIFRHTITYLAEITLSNSPSSSNFSLNYNVCSCKCITSRFPGLDSIPRRVHPHLSYLPPEPWINFPEKQSLAFSSSNARPQLSRCRVSRNTQPGPISGSYFKYCPHPKTKQRLLGCSYARTLGHSYVKVALHSDDCRIKSLF